MMNPSTRILLVGALLGGCTVMVNGKPRRLGGSDEPTAAAAPAPVSTGAGAPAATGSPPAHAAAPVVPRGQVLAVPATLTRDPLVASIDGIVFDTTWSKVFGHGSKSPDCGMQLPSQPIASFQLTAQDPALVVSLVGGSEDGFVVRRGDQYWITCTHSIGQAPTLTAGGDGWAPGRYDIYPVARYAAKDKPVGFALELYKPGVAPASEPPPVELVLSGKLDRPRFVEVSVRAGRRQLRDVHAGARCGKLALPATPDLALTIERPLPGLTVRPLPTTMPVTLRRELLGEAASARSDRYCVSGDGGGSRSGGRGRGPSYQAPSELAFGKEEGTIGISLGTPDPRAEGTVTLMIYDDSTQFDELTVWPFGGEERTLAQRWIALHLPQLDLDGVGVLRDYADAERAARVYAAVPSRARVYAKLDLDQDLASGSSPAFPVKDEPLVVIGFDRERATVLAADGHRFQLGTKHLVLAPTGAPAWPAAPRPLRNPSMGATIALLPPTAKAHGDAWDRKAKARQACRDRAWAPYGRQLPTITRPSNVDIVVVKNARYNQIERQGALAMDRKCGTDEAFARQRDAAQAKLAVHVEQGRAALLARVRGAE